jgi:hypothetical protein
MSMLEWQKMEWRHNARERLKLIRKQQIRNGNEISRTETLRGKTRRIKIYIK